MKEYIVKKLNTQKEESLFSAKNVDTRQISSLVNSLITPNTDDINYPSRLKRHRAKLNSIIKDFQKVYKDLLSQEITIMNLDIAAESIKERNNLVEDIHDVVEKDRIKVYQGR